MDETPVQVLKENGRKAQSKSYFWLIRTGEDGLNPIVLYNYTPTRTGNNAEEFLKGMESGFYLMADGFQGYNKVKNVNRCTCWAHIRRYLLEAIPKGQDKDYSNPAVQGVLYCNKLFEYERSYKEKGLSHKQIKKRRLKDQKPVIEGFLLWIKQLDPGSNGKLKKAKTYTMYLTIVEMAKAYDLNLYEYLKFLLEHRTNENMSDEELDHLAPWSIDVQEQCGIKE